MILDPSLGWRIFEGLVALVLIGGAAVVLALDVRARRDDAEAQRGADRRRRLDAAVRLGRPWPPARGPQ